MTSVSIAVPSVDIGAVCVIAKGGIDPQRHASTLFAHYSIPAFDAGARPVIEAGAEIHSQKTPIPSGAVLVSKLNPRIPRVWCVNDDAPQQRICTTEFVPLIPDRSRLQPEYLAYAVRGLMQTGAIKGNTAAATKSRERAKPADFLRLKIPLPSLSEQDRIVDLLSRAENIVRMRREAEKKAREIIPALFLDMFGDPATNPKGWEVAELRDHIELLTGYPFKSKEFVPEGETVRLCRGANVLPQQVDWSDARHWPACRCEEFAEFALRRGDIVLAMDRPWISSGLKVARIAESDLPALLVQRVARIRPKPTLAASYVYVSLCHSSFAAHCNAVKTETVVPHISPNDIRSYRMPIPPIFAQARFASVVDGVEGLAKQAGQALEMAVDAFQSLLAGVFSEGVAI